MEASTTEIHHQGRKGKMLCVCVHHRIDERPGVDLRLCAEMRPNGNDEIRWAISADDVYINLRNVHID